MLPGMLPSFHDPMKSVAVLPQTVVVPAGIPLLEPCFGVVGLNATHLVAETRARIPKLGPAPIMRSQAQGEGWQGGWQGGLREETQ